APTPLLCAASLAVALRFRPEETLFLEGWQAFVADHHLLRGGLSAARCVEQASRTLWIERGRTEIHETPEDAAPTSWDLARVRRRLERNLVQTGLLLRRARCLCLLADADVAFRERGRDGARALRVSRGEIVERRELDGVEDVRTSPARRPCGLRERQRLFDARAYDRLRVLLTELQRVREEGGEVALRVGRHYLAGERLNNLLRTV
ncbi:MAG TPA: hypothetical protein VK524_26305, partial [Polyangiaceae bacterium]|nr:hypothetical protein [Polyangiaceae bacterium]